MIMPRNPQRLPPELLDQARQGWHNKGMTTTSHRDCTHPATKAARAKCRKMRAQEANELKAVIEGYYDNSLDAEEIGAALITLCPEAADAFFSRGLPIDEVIAIAKGE